MRTHATIQRRRAITGALLALLALLLSGCVELAVESDFAEDGSVRHTVGGVVERAALDRLSEAGDFDLGVLTDQDAARQLAEQRGLEYTPIDTADEFGGRFSRDFPESNDLGETLVSLYSETLQGVGPALPAGAFDGAFEQHGETWTFWLTIDADQLLTMAAGSGADVTEQLGLVDQYLNLTYSATFPGTVEETDGTRLSDTEILWNLPLSGQATLSASGRVGTEGGGSSAFVVLLVAALICGGGLVLGYWWLTRKHTTPPLESSRGPGAGVAAGTAAYIATDMLLHHHHPPTDMNLPPSDPGI